MTDIERRLLSALASNTTLSTSEILTLRNVAREANKLRDAKREVSRMEYELRCTTLPGDDFRG